MHVTNVHVHACNNLLWYCYFLDWMLFFYILSFFLHLCHHSTLHLFPVVVHYISFCVFQGGEKCASWRSCLVNVGCILHHSLMILAHVLARTIIVTYSIGHMLYACVVLSGRAGASTLVAKWGRRLQNSAKLTSSYVMMQKWVPHYRVTSS